MSQAAAAETAANAPLVIGRYALFDELAAGGMATVHLGRLLGPVGFGRTVAVKRLHAHYLRDQEFITMFMDEARIVARIRHPNVVPMVDVVQGDQGLFLVMEYVHGESLSRLMRTARQAKEPISPRIVAAIMCGVLLGLHSAHDTKGPDGQLLNVVHRDVSPQNVIVGADGAARVLDFGIAKAAGRAQVTREGQIKGKLAYMAPEQIRGQVDRRTDVFAAAVVLWELLAGRRLHEGSKDVDIVTRVVQGNFSPPSAFAPHIDPGLDAIVLRGLETDPKKRYQSARELALELERKVGLASPSEVTEWVERLARDVLQARGNLVSAMELAARDLIAIESNPPPPSLSMGTPVVIPAQANIPVHFDAAPPVSNGDVPSSSAVFAHAQTNALPPVDARAPRPVDRVSWAIVAVSATLAIVGASLGAYALIQRSARAAHPIVAPSATTLPRTTLPGVAGSGVPDPGVSGPVAPVAGSSVPVGSGAPASDSAEPGATVELDDKPATVSASPLPTPSASVSAKPGAFLPPPLATARKPSAKPQCEPAYTLDDVGHRHYKPECMGLE